MSERMLCAIPARGGSKRLPRKNLRPLAGRPLIAHSISAARDSGLFSEVFVCTEDAEIADVARRYGASVPFLIPTELCDDMVSSHAPCEYLAQQLGNYDSLLCLQPSSPLRSAEDVRGAHGRFRESNCDFLVSITAVDPHYFHWALHQEHGDWRMFFGDKFLQERPLLPPIYRPNGSIKIAKLSELAEVGHFFGPRLEVIETPEERSIHVATEFDLEACEFLLSRVPA